MKKNSIIIPYWEYDNEQELTEDERSLIMHARKASLNAYSPYSKFRVGAAIRLQNNVIITGNNQENAAYPSGLCAERVAMFAAAAEYPGVPFVSMAITAGSELFTIDKPFPPCGSCRQVMAEYENRDKSNMKIILAGENGKGIVFEGVRTLLPFMFSKEDLHH